MEHLFDIADIDLIPNVADFKARYDTDIERYNQLVAEKNRLEKVRDEIISVINGG